MRLALIAAIIATPAVADVPVPRERPGRADSVEIIAPDTGPALVLRYANAAAQSSNQVWQARIDTPHGAVVYSIRINQGDDGAERLTLVDWPPGLIPDEITIDVKDGDAGEIAFFPALSGLPVVRVSETHLPRNCGPSAEINGHLRREYGERIMMRGHTAGGAVFEMWGADAGTWTAVIRRPNGVSCIYVVGDRLEVLSVIGERV